MENRLLLKPNCDKFTLEYMSWKWIIQLFSKEHENIIDISYVRNSLYSSSASKTSSKSSLKSISCKKAVFSSSSACFISNWLILSG